MFRRSIHNIKRYYLQPRIVKRWSSQKLSEKNTHEVPYEKIYAYKQCPVGLIGTCINKSTCRDFSNSDPRIIKGYRYQLFVLEMISPAIVLTIARTLLAPGIHTFWCISAGVAFGSIIGIPRFHAIEDINAVCQCREDPNLQKNCEEPKNSSFEKN